MQYAATYSGHRFYPLTQHISKVSIDDIAQGLGFQCRFNGQCAQFYSVAQHSWLVMEQFRRNCVKSGFFPTGVEMLAALMHDAAEYLIGDMISPIKVLFPEFKAMEKLIEQSLAKEFGYEGVDHHIEVMIKQADLEVRAREKDVLLPYSTEAWDDLAGITAAQVAIEYVGPDTAPAMFKQHFSNITKLLKAA